MTFEGWSPLMEALPQGLVLVDGSGIVARANEAACRMLGCERRHLGGVEFQIVREKALDERGRSASFSELPVAIAVRQGEGLAESIFGIETENGRTIWLAGSVTPVEKGVLVVLENVTHHRNTEAILEARLRIVDVAQEGTTEDVLRTTIDEAERLTGSCIGFLHFMDEDQNSLRLQTWSTGTQRDFCRAEGHGLHYPIEQAGVWADCVRQKQPIIHNDYASLPDKRGMPPGHAEVSRELVVPVTRRGKIVAILGVGNKPFPYGDDDLSMVRLLADLAWDTAENKRTTDALAASERRHLTLFRATPDGILYIEQDGSIREVNDAACTMTGYTRAELHGLRISDLVAIESREGEAKWNVKTLLDGGTERFEIELKRRNGSLFAADVSATHLPELNLLVAFVRDITPRKRAERSLKESEANFRAIYESEPACVKVVSANGILLDMNPAGLAMVEAGERGDVIGRPVGDLVAPEYRDAFTEISRRALSGRPAEGEFEIIGCRGTRRWMETSAVPLPDNAGEVRAYLAVTRDVTDRHRSQESLRESERKLRSLFELSPLGIARSTMEGRLVEFNEAFRRITGYPREELLQMDYWVLTPDEYDPQEQEQLHILRGSGRYGPFEKEYLHKDGRRIPVRLNGILVMGSGGSSYAWSIVEDLSMEKELEKERRYVEKQVTRAQKLESLGSLAGGVAHDINNVLGAIMSLASIQKEEAEPGSTCQEDMETIIRACARGGTLVKGLLGFARSGLAEEALFDLNDLVTDSIRLLERTTLQKVRLTTDLADRPLPIRGDVSAVSHALMNLCVNASDAMPDGGVLRIRTSLEPTGMALLEVMDNGVGMEPAVLERAFDPFFTTKPQGQGTGLGLPIAYGAIKAHRGQMELRSTPGDGTTVSIFLPLYEGHPVEDARIDRPRERVRGLEVLAVDDDELIQQILARTLRLLGHSPRIVSTAEEALELLEDEAYRADLVVLDLNMPGLGGSAALPMIRALRPAIPVLLITGRPDQAAVDLSCSVDDLALLAKPFTTQQLGSVLSTMIGSGEVDEIL